MQYICKTVASKDMYSVVYIYFFQTNIDILNTFSHMLHIIPPSVPPSDCLLYMRVSMMQIRSVRHPLPPVYLRSTADRSGAQRRRCGHQSSPRCLPRDLPQALREARVRGEGLGGGAASTGHRRFRRVQRCVAQGHGRFVGVEVIVCTGRARCMIARGGEGGGWYS